jgi:integrase
MAGRQAKILSAEQIETLLAYAAATRHPSRNRVIVLLSVKAGLRASEIANVTWDMVSSGRINQLVPRVASSAPKRETDAGRCEAAGQ